MSGSQTLRRERGGADGRFSLSYIAAVSYVGSRARIAHCIGRNRPGSRADRLPGYPGRYRRGAEAALGIRHTPCVPGDILQMRVLAFSRVFSRGERKKGVEVRMSHARDPHHSTLPASHTPWSEESEKRKRERAVHRHSPHTQSSPGEGTEIPKRTHQWESITTTRALRCAPSPRLRTPDAGAMPPCVEFCANRVATTYRHRCDVRQRNRRRAAIAASA